MKWDDNVRHPEAVFIPKGSMWRWLDQKRKWGVILGYTLFGLTMFLLFLYLTFPFSLLELKLISIIEAESGCKIAVDQRGFHFPSRLSWKGIRGSCPQPAFSQWKIDSLNAELAPLPLLFSRRGEVDFQLKLAGGELAGHLTAVEGKGGPSLSLQAEGKKIDLAPFGLSGLLSGEGEGSWVGQDVLKGKGSVTFTLDAARFKEIGTWVVPIGEVSFSNVRGKIFWRNGTVALERFSAEGESVDLNSEGGNLLLREPLAASLLTLTLKATPKGSLRQVASVFVQGYSGREPLTVGMKGPLGQPQFSINGKAVNQ
jgi:type II secretion system protein N